MCLAIRLSRSAIPYGPFAFSQFENRGFVREAESQSDILIFNFPLNFPLLLDLLISCHSYFF